MNLNRGMIKDLAPDMLPEGAWFDAQGIVVNNPANTISNEPGMSAHGESFEDYWINGYIALNEGYIRFLVDNLGNSRIDHVSSNGTTTPIIEDSVLNFSKDRPIEGVFINNYKKETIIAWWEGVEDDANPPRILNIDSLPFTLNLDYSFVDPNDVELLTLMSNIRPPKMTLQNVRDTGGALRSGAYSVFVFYESTDGTRTGYTILGNTVPIYSNRIDVEVVGQFLSLQGDDGDILTTKSFEIQLTGLDNRYAKIGIGVISKNAGIISGFVDNVYSITNSTMNFVITGASLNIETVDITTILTPSIIYTKAQTGAVYNNQLYLYNVRTEDTLTDSLQEIANDIVVHFYAKDEDKVSVDYAFTEESYKLPIVCHNRRSLMYDEVYALYVGFITKKGKSIHHIPGRVAAARLLKHYSDEGHVSGLPASDVSSNDRELLSVIIAANPGLNLFNLEQAVDIDPDARVFHFFNTASIGPDFYTITPGYWENADEIYPANFPDFAGENVRHHRTPSWQWMNTNLGERDFGGLGGSKAMLPLGVRFSNINIPVNLQNEILAIEFFYAARGVNNSLHVATNRIEDFVIADPLTSRMNDFELLLKKPVLSASYVKCHHYLEGQADPALPSGTDVYNFTKNLGYVAYRPLRRITDIRYVPNDSTISVDNENREEVVYFEFDALLEATAVKPAIYSLMASLMRHQQNMYLGYAAQQLVSFGTLAYVGETEVVTYGGDTFITPQSIKVVYGPPLVPSLILIVPTLSVTNTFLRQEGLANWQKFYPYSDPNDFTLDPGTDIYDYDDYKEYNEDYSAVQNFDAYEEYIVNGEPSSSTGFTDKFPYRIARSLPQSSESSEQGWRVFLANEYYEMPANKGEGWALRTLNKSLMIQTVNTLFVAIAKDRLSTNNLELALGRGDIFATDPDEVITDQGGYFGCRHKWSAFVCKLGYVAVDDKRGKILIFDGQAKEISAQGMRNFFTEYSKIFFNVDNPFQGNGWCAGYDERNNRILFTRWEGLSDIVISDYLRNTNYTISYSPDIGWICFNAYVPNGIFHNRDGLYIIRNRTTRNTYKHNTGAYGMFYNEALQSSWVAVPIVNNQQISKVNSGVSWSTSVRNSHGVEYVGKTLTHIMAYNNHQCTGRIALTVSKSILPDAHNVARVRDRWFFNKLRDIVVNPSALVIDQDTAFINVSNLNANQPWHDIRRFALNYIIYRLEYDNVENLKCIIKSIEAEQQTNV